MGFKFTLDVVLRLRQSLEEREFRELERVQFEISKTLNVLHSIDAQREQMVQARFGALKQGISATELHGLCASESGLDSYKVEMTEKLNLLRKKRLEQLEIYKRTRMNREVLTELRSQQKDAYNQRTAHAEQKQIDDVFSSRRSRN